MNLSQYRRVYSGGIAAQTTTAVFTGTYTGLMLTNPAASGVTLEVVEVGCGFTVAFGAVSCVGLMGLNYATVPTQGNAITPYSLGGNLSTGNKGLLTSSSSITGTALLLRVLMTGLTGAVTTAPFEMAQFRFDDGSLVLPPKSFLAIYTSAASGTNGGNFTFTWAENPL